MSVSSRLIAVSALFAVAVVTTATIAQAPQTPAAPPATAATSPLPHRSYPAPTNLKVLPKTLTGEQVHALMEQWEAALGVHCSTCHTADPTNIGPNGRPRLNYADDSKPEKSTARLMYKMTEDINQNYVSMVENSGAPVTCGTCHRGHFGPEPFVAPEHDSKPKPEAAPPAAAPVSQK